MEERFLYHIWDEGHLIPELRTVSGKSVRIVYQGQYNTGRGPDFKNAIIELDHEQLRGDVEIHLKSSDWQAHNHQEDIYYNKVVLHVVLNHNSAYPYTIREDGGSVEVLELKHQLSEDILKLTQDQEFPAKASAYCDLLSALDKDRLISILHMAGIRRFEGKIKRFNSALSLSSFDQIFYEGVFEAIGYDKNKLNTMQIAQSLPISMLREFLSEGMSADDLLAIYLGASGLLARSGSLISNQNRERIMRDYETQPYFARNLEIDWQLFRVRPQSHPLKRLIYISPIIHASLQEGLFHYTLRHTLDAENLHKAFRAIWQPQISSDGQAFNLGKMVQDNIYLNIFLPILCLWQRKMAQDTNIVMNAYREYSALPENHITRFMHRYLNPSQIELSGSKAIYQQGLMDIYHRFCNWHLCAECKQRADIS
ncbi:MAG: DUF2851 family protein [Candidatus Cloacimonetes bacterium]|nr:DUF2851 family protein [Candidatus Cloacimonadota bacterium]